MVLSAVVFLEKLPLTSNGKIDRKALPKPLIQLDHQNGPVAPRTTIETQLVAIWEEVLNTHPIVVTDNFFTGLDGTSLQPLRIFNQLDHIPTTHLPITPLID